MLFLTVLLGISVLLEGCSDKCQVTSEYAYYEPVYTTMEEIRADVKLEDPKPVTSLGKIYFKDDILFVNEPGNGIHIIDNHDPANPKALKFLHVPGNVDMAVKGNTLYADSYLDLVAFDIHNLNAVKEVGRIKNVITTSTNALGFYVDGTRGVVTDMKQTKVINISQPDCDAVIQPWGGMLYDNGVVVSMQTAAAFNTKAAITPGTGSGPGVGGSLARMAINANHLFMLDGADLQSIDITSEQSPVAKTRTNVNWGIETIFPYKDKLFLGSTSGMYIFSVSSPEAPALLSTYEHVRSCDPVVVDDKYAYVTLRSGNSCQGFSNQLEVIDIADLQAPQLIKIYPLTNPHGLGIDDHTLFVCDGDDGLKAFDATDVTAIDKNLLAHYKDINGYDVIPFDKILMLVGSDGIFQYDYSDKANIKLLSHIDVEPAQ
ncbi:LVIVD repeat-containing protein [Chryseolinea lacunae]|uniref:LVIVD repeat-containing protein n=1 Tax=Chryseolinea lacunae TaxID=2801331 RepID=A0ABS1KWM9_9BACT|nr:hypothetical protein [Chryseolinea lacunae]MBL0743814.1 hypothetical protein [Chryseolinea lacunae]